MKRLAESLLKVSLFLALILLGLFVIVGAVELLREVLQSRSRDDVQVA
jgi:hypothetical protein